MTVSLLIILDGWGHGEPSQYNAIHQAHTPNWDQHWSTCPTSLLECSGEHVGLPTGQMGNSEVGHLTMGAGRVIDQDLTRINTAIKDGSFAESTVLNDMARSLGSKRIHVLGLYSPGGVHSHEDQIDFLVTTLLSATSKVSVHCFLDGRDTPPKSARASLVRLEQIIHQANGTGVASIAGRYYAMDRDKRWARTKLAFDMLTKRAHNTLPPSAVAALEEAYDRHVTDEFVHPIQTQHFVPIKDGDVVIFMNFRADRARQLASAFVLEEFQDFECNHRPRLSQFITLTTYSKTINESPHPTPVSTLFPIPSVSNTLGAYFAERGMRQLRVAESEKYAHVTYFFSGGQELPFEYETRTIIDSPTVKTYDLQPEMSADSVTDTILSAMHSANYDVIICNFANGDMVGHTGKFDASVRAVECLDQCLGRIFQAAGAKSAHCFVTADHGNVEHLYDAPIDQANTAHTNNPVPFLYVGPLALKLRSHGALADIAPTILDVLNLPVPVEMTGKSLVTS